ncbi:ABC transporter ATP-binding protein [Halocynthiibacter styelae]|uniref:ABC transporter ATP-binding protein n=1 Tax=Halocynthiibacter styelae TaxID=2761955 RepID=A0A8J7IFG9_9RHOB|nr:ABC transporter ATP-binding protein [Paenihalocynthiibacter styelae]MBI1494982.1 ABC transporter ATP-binding protein [Paenihalocynthiibacter styelae]
MTQPVLQLTDLHYRWPGREGFALSVPGFSVVAGESVLLLGESGSGKSTLLSLICGTVKADRGLVQVVGQDLAALSGSGRDRFRAEQIGVIFQQFNLLPFGSVADNILLPLRFAPARRKRAGVVKDTARALCQALGLPDALFQAKAGMLSVGQQQRVAVARALIGQPPLIIADEPTSALDANSQAAFLDLLFRQSEAQKSALLMVSHDPRLGERFDRVVDLSDVAGITRGAA